MSGKVEFRDIEILIKDGRLDDARSALDSIIASLDGEGEDRHSLAEAYFRRGKIAWRQGRRAEAQGDYARAVALDPSSQASMALQQAREVDAFFHHDLYNP